MKNAELSLNALKPALRKIIGMLRPYVGLMMLVFFAIIYGYIILQINSLSDTPVDPSAVTEESKTTPTPQIDAAAVKQLETLKDNSVNVQTLFEQTRQNPFEE